MEDGARQVHKDHISLKENKGSFRNDTLMEPVEQNDSKVKENDKSPDKNSPGKSPVCDSEKWSVRASPEPSCAICLGKLENKSFTDSCFHTFCFTCLLEWSKVKAECPLCKQPFKSIVHNVRSIEDYDQYYINSRVSVSSWQSPDGRRFRYPSTLTQERRRHISFEESLEYQNHRLTYAPHSLHSSVTRNLIDHPSTSNFRRRIYENGFWVSPLGTGNTSRYRDTSPEFYRQNPACTHRLIPWLNRELIALLYDSESQVRFVLELILALIMRYDIRSQEFYVHIQPYIQDRTSHFIHEFYNFARSPHDMVAYDRNAMYEQLESVPEQSSVVSTPGSDVIALPSGNSPEELPSTSNQSQDVKCGQASESQNTDCSPRSLTKLFLIRNHENDTWQSTFERNSFSRVDVDSDSSSTIPYDRIPSPRLSTFETDLPGPSTSSGRRAARKSNKHSKRIIDDISDSDCIVVSVIKPKSQRTPEIIDLVSSSSDEVDNITTLNTLLTAVAEKSSAAKIVEEKREKQSVVDKKDNELGKKREKSRYSRETVIKRSHSKAQRSSRYSSEHSSHSHSSHSRKSTGHHSKERLQSRPYSKSAKSFSSASKSPSSSPHRTRKRSQSRHKYRNEDYHLDSSTDISFSDDDFQQTNSYSKDAKLKVRSVVWQFSSHHHFSSAGKSHHSSSNKKHKEKKKKKHKHKHHHSHKYKVYTSSSDTA